jgi:coenzyme PQQ precursor peptide PqqA
VLPSILGPLSPPCPAAAPGRCRRVKEKVMWQDPAYEIVETGLEVTAYCDAE